MIVRTTFALTFALVSVLTISVMFNCDSVVPEAAPIHDTVYVDKPALPQKALLRGSKGESYVLDSDTLWPVESNLVAGWYRYACETECRIYQEEK